MANPVAEISQRWAVGGYAKIADMAPDHSFQPLPHFFERIMHAFPQFQANRLELRLHPPTDCLPYHHEPSSSGLPANMREAQKVEGFRLPFAPLLPVLGRKASKLQESRFLRVEFQIELLHPRLQFSQEPLGLRLVLESQHHVIGIAHRYHLATGDLPLPGLNPFI